MGKSFCRVIDVVNEWTGRLVSLLFLPLVLLVVIEVVLRYFFNRPTAWAWPIIIYLGALLATLGAGYTLIYGGHVKVDIVTARFSSRTRAIIDLVTSSVFFLGLMVLVWKGTDEAVYSVQIREHYTVYRWWPILYPLRIGVAIGFLLLLFQGVAKLIRDLNTAIRTGKERIP